MVDPEAADRLRRWVGDRKLRGARDQPPAFPGRPNPGGTMEPLDQECGANENYDARALDCPLGAASVAYR
jgi:hypothetical protein